MTVCRWTGPRGPGTGVEGPRLMQSARSIGVGLKVQFCHPRSQVVRQEPLRSLSSFSRPEAFEVFIFFLGPDCMYSSCTSDCIVFQIACKSYILTFPLVSLELFLRAIWGAVSQAAVLILPQIKLNLQFSHCAFFKVNILHLSSPSILKSSEMLSGFFLVSQVCRKSPWLLEIGSPSPPQPLQWLPWGPTHLEGVYDPGEPKTMTTGRHDSLKCFGKRRAVNSASLAICPSLLSSKVL